MSKEARINREFAEELAIQALSFLAQDPERLGRFLAVTGIGPEMIREAAAEPRFLAGILDHVVADQSLLIAAADYAGVAPQDFERAHQALSGAQWEREAP